MDADTRDQAWLSRELAALQARLDELTRSSSRGDVDQSLLTELSVAQEELRVADEELHAQQEELDRLLTGQLRRREAHRQFIGRLAVPVLVTDAAGMIRVGNGPAAVLLGVRQQRLSTKPVFAFVVASERPALRARLNRALHGNETHFETRAQFVLRAGNAVELDVAATLDQPDPAAGLEVTWVLLGAPDAHPDAGGNPGLARALVELAQVPLASFAPDAVARRMAGLCQDAFPVPVRVSLTLGDPLMPDIVATDSAEAQVLDGAQLVAGEGPCLEAYRLLTTVWTTDIGVDNRWPRLGRHMAKVPRAAVLATPVVADGQAVGVLNLYVGADSADSAGTETLVQAAELVAATVGTVLQEVSMRSELETVVTQLQTALESRATIDQAKGIVMARYGCDADEAFRILARLSSNANVKLREIARRLVDDAAAGGSS